MFIKLPVIRIYSTKPKKKKKKKDEKKKKKRGLGFMLNTP